MKGRVFVGRLAKEVTEQDLLQVFAEAGEVLKATVKIDRDSGESRGFGFVQMADEAAALKAIRLLDGRDLLGRKIRVVQAQPQVRMQGAKGGTDSLEPTWPPHTYEGPPLKQLRWFKLALVAALLGLVAMGTAWWLTGLRARAPVDVMAVAVAPFEVRGQEAGKYLGEAFAQALAVNLAAVKSLHVLPVDTSGDQGEESRVKRARRRGAGRMLSGTLTRRQDNTLLIGLTLVDTVDNRIIWGTQSEAPDREALEFAAQLAEEVAQALGGQFPKLYDHITHLTGGATLSTSPTTARALEALRHGDIEASTKATEALIKAFPKSPIAAALRSQALALQWDAKPTAEDRQKFEESLSRLSELDAQAPYPAVYRAYILQHERETDGALALFSEVLKRADLSPAARAWVLRYRAATRQIAGDRQGALDDLDESLRLDPTNPWTLNILSSSLEQAGRYEEALIRAQQSVALMPSYWRNHQSVGTALSGLKRWPEAAQAFAKSCDLGATQLPCSLWAVALIKAGETKKAQEVVQRASRFPDNTWGVYNLACYFALNSQPDKAVAYLKKAIGLGLNEPLMATDPDLQSLHGLAGFEKLLQEVKGRQKTPGLSP